MRSLIFAGLLVAGAGASAMAQPAAVEGRRVPGAELLLARTGELGLTDAQVTRLAAIARRGAARRAAMRATRDSMRARFTPGTRPDSSARRQLVDRMRADMERAREQERADRRDAIAVLTPEQQARAWELVASRPGGQRGMHRGGRNGRGGRGGMRRGEPGGVRGPIRPLAPSRAPGDRPGMPRRPV